MCGCLCAIDSSTTHLAVKTHLPKGLSCSQLQWFRDQTGSLWALCALRPAKKRFWLRAEWCVSVSGLAWLWWQTMRGLSCPSLFSSQLTMWLLSLATPLDTVHSRHSDCRLAASSAVANFIFYIYRIYLLYIKLCYILYLYCKYTWHGNDII